MRSYPVVLRYESWEVVRRRCCWRPPDQAGHCEETWTEPCERGWEHWRWEDEYGCREHIEVLPDPIDLGTISFWAILSQQSRDWIEGELSFRYPGARVRHPNWELIPDGGWSGTLGGDSTFTIDATLLNIQFEDPGIYEVTLSARTTGTRYTHPYHIYEQFEIRVYLIDAALVW
jgi:hypothetical protein